MHAKSVLTTLPVLSAAAYPCLTSSEAVVIKAPAPRLPPAVARTIVRFPFVRRVRLALVPKETFCEETFCCRKQLGHVQVASWTRLVAKPSLLIAFFGGSAYRETKMPEGDTLPPTLSRYLE